jgi:hypothetical protein
MSFVGADGRVHEKGELDPLTTRPAAEILNCGRALLSPLPHRSAGAITSSASGRCSTAVTPTDVTRRSAATTSNAPPPSTMTQTTTSPRSTTTPMCPAHMAPATTMGSRQARTTTAMLGLAVPATVSESTTRTSKRLGGKATTVSIPKEAPADVAATSFSCTQQATTRAHWTCSTTRSSSQWMHQQNGRHHTPHATPHRSRRRSRRRSQTTCSPPPTTAAPGRIATTGRLLPAQVTARSTARSPPSLVTS